MRHSNDVIIAVSPDRSRPRGRWHGLMSGRCAAGWLMPGGIDWAGIYPGALTMFDAAGRLDQAATAAPIERLVDEGAHGVVVAGTSGEFVSMDDEERRRSI